ncbi:hypothetical protein [Vibrio brasiliensis]|uniref:hypothetical protein n=1 Tax=Vibrio brasiliensis TaxID=170652 RepID=UPI001EFEC58A|nr:hypothetical protein [Vibrio brasiliensis]
MKYLSSTLLLGGLLVGCSTTDTVDIKQAEQQWLDCVELCMELASGNEVLLPDSDWFDSLSLEDQKMLPGFWLITMIGSVIKRKRVSLLRLLSRKTIRNCLSAA